tara:strand:- start:775 stop:2526 length:1752 start_codon:yes stop_codon:yes gene_type:complete
MKSTISKRRAGVTFTSNSGTMSGGTLSLDKSKYQLKKDVKGVKIGNNTNVVLPKGTILYNVAGGLFADHKSLEQYADRNKRYFKTNTVKGIQITQKVDTIKDIEKNSKVLYEEGGEVDTSVSKRRAGAELKQKLKGKRSDGMGEYTATIYGMDDGKRVELKGLNDLNKYSEFEIDESKTTYAEGGEIEADLKSIKNKYPNAKVSYYFAKNNNGKSYVVTAKEKGKTVYSSYKQLYEEGGRVKYVLNGFEESIGYIMGSGNGVEERREGSREDGDLVIYFVTPDDEYAEGGGVGKGYYIKVDVRDAKKSLSILDDMYRKKFFISNGITSHTYYFKDEEMAYDAKMDLAARDIQVTDTNIEEYAEGGELLDWDDLQNDELRNCFIAMYNDLIDSEFAIQDFKIDSTRNLIVYFREEDFSDVEKIKLNRFLGKYTNEKVKPEFCRFIKEIKVEGNRVYVYTKESIYAEGGEIEEIDEDYYSELKEKGIDRYSFEASQLWKQKYRDRYKKAKPTYAKGGKMFTPQGREILYQDENVALQHNTVTDSYSMINPDTGVYMEKGGTIKSKGNEMLIGGIAGVLLGMFLKK